MTGKSRAKKTIGYYLRIYFASILVSIVITVTGSILSLRPLCANSKTCSSDLTASVNNNLAGIFEGHKVIPPKISPGGENTGDLVLGAKAPSGQKHIYVDLENQILYAYQGRVKIMQTPISSGKWGITPVGDFNIWEKLPSTRMAGGEGAAAYDLPNVPYVMYFYNDFGLHGAYWHNNFGHPMSHGCVNMRIVDARDLYNWADGPTSNTKGTPVSVCSRFFMPNKCIQDNPIN